MTSRSRDASQSADSQHRGSSSSGAGRTARPAVGFTDDVGRQVTRVPTRGLHDPQQHLADPTSVLADDGSPLSLDGLAATVETLREAIIAISGSLTSELRQIHADMHRCRADVDAVKRRVALDSLTVVPPSLLGGAVAGGRGVFFNGSPWSASSGAGRAGATLESHGAPPYDAAGEEVDGASPEQTAPVTRATFASLQRQVRQLSDARDQELRHCRGDITNLKADVERLRSTLGHGGDANSDASRNCTAISSQKSPVALSSALAAHIDTYLVSRDSMLMDKLRGEVEAQLGTLRAQLTQGLLANRGDMSALRRETQSKMDQARFRCSDVALESHQQIQRLAEQVRGALSHVTEKLQMAAPRPFSVGLPLATNVAIAPSDATTLRDPSAEAPRVSLGISISPSHN